MHIPELEYTPGGGGRGALKNFWFFGTLLKKISKKKEFEWSSAAAATIIYRIPN
jgi:hypothetical protein